MLETLEIILKYKTNNGVTVPAIRYFDGANVFCDCAGKYKSDTLEGSLKLFLKELFHK